MRREHVTKNKCRILTVRSKIGDFIEGKQNSIAMTAGGTASESSPIQKLRQGSAVVKHILIVIQRFAKA